MPLGGTRDNENSDVGSLVRATSYRHDDVIPPLGEGELLVPTARVFRSGVGRPFCARACAAGIGAAEY